MKVLFLSTTYPTPVRPRQGMFNFHLIDSLRLHHDVRVIAPIPMGQLLPMGQLRGNGGIAPDGQSSREGPIDFHPTYYYLPKLFRHLTDHFYWWSILPAVNRLGKTFKPDLVLGYWLHPDGAAAQRVASRFGVPCVVFSGGSDLRRLTANRKRKQAIQHVLSQADHLVVVSRDLAKVATELGIPANKIDVTYRGVNQRCFHPIDRAVARQGCQVSDDAVVLLWSGRLEPVKNPRLLLYAASQWKKHWGNRLQVLIAGDGAMRSELASLHSRLGLVDCVRFEGNLRQDDLALRYNAANVTVLTSHSEGIPNVLLESISCGTPFVATDVGGISEIASSELDRLVPDDDEAALVQAVIEHVESPRSSKREFVPNGLAEMAARFETVFEKVLLDHTSSSDRSGSSDGGGQ